MATNKTGPGDRKERLAAALRANLKRRKARVRTAKPSEGASKAAKREPSPETDGRSGR